MKLDAARTNYGIVLLFTWINGLFRTQVWMLFTPRKKLLYASEVCGYIKVNHKHSVCHSRGKVVMSTNLQIVWWSDSWSLIHKGFYRGKRVEKKSASCLCQAAPCPNSHKVYLLFRKWLQNKIRRLYSCVRIMTLALSWNNWFSVCETI